MTEKQLKLFTFIRNFIAHSDKGPTFREMKEYMKVKSNQTIYDWLEILEREHYISRQTGKQFGISLGEKGLSLEPTVKFDSETAKPKDVYIPLSPNASTPPEIEMSFLSFPKIPTNEPILNINATSTFFSKGGGNSGSS